MVFLASSICCALNVWCSLGQVLPNLLPLGSLTSRLTPNSPDAPAKPDHSLLCCRPGSGPDQRQANFQVSAQGKVHSI